MSGHSHAKTILHKKQSEDAKRGKAFSKISRLISVAVKDGNEPRTNAKLRSAIGEAKRFGMPKDNIEKAIKRGSGELEGETLEEITYEGIGPASTSLIIECITDNKNRTLSEIKQILQKHNGKLADEGSVKWLFEQKGILVLSVVEQNKEALEMKAIEAGAEDTQWQKQEDEEFLEVITKPEELEKVKKDFETQNIKIESATLGWTPKEEIEISPTDQEKCQNLFEDLDESEAVQEIYSNLKA